MTFVRMYVGTRKRRPTGTGRQITYSMLGRTGTHKCRLMSAQPLPDTYAFAEDTVFCPSYVEGNKTYQHLGALNAIAKKYLSAVVHLHRKEGGVTISAFKRQGRFWVSEREATMRSTE